MKVFAIRHAHSTANAAEVPAGMSAGDLAFANRSAGLDDKGIEQCAALAPQLPEQYGIIPATTRVAVSEYERAELTAKLLGFAELQESAKLNEVDHNMDLHVLRGMLRQNQIPDIARLAARSTLENPPEESVWVTHGLLIAGLCIELGIVEQYERPVPRQCEVRELTF